MAYPLIPLTDGMVVAGAARHFEFRPKHGYSALATHLLAPSLQCQTFLGRDAITTPRENIFAPRRLPAVRQQAAGAVGRGASTLRPAHNAGAPVFKA